MAKSQIEQAAARYNSLFSEDDMLDDAVNKYIRNEITKDDLLFYLEWNEFDMSDVDWNEIEKARKKERKVSNG